MICWYLVGRGDGSKTCQSNRTAGLVVGAGGEVKDLLSRMDPDVSLSVGLHRGRSWRRRCRVRRRTQAWEGTGLFHQIPGGYLVLIVAGHQIYKQFLCIFCQGHCWLVRMGLAILSTESNRVFSLLAVPYSAQFSASVLLYSSYAIATQHQVLGTTIICHLSHVNVSNLTVTFPDKICWPAMMEITKNVIKSDLKRSVRVLMAMMQLNQGLPRTCGITHIILTTPFLFCACWLSSMIWKSWNDDEIVA